MREKTKFLLVGVAVAAAAVLPAIAQAGHGAFDDNETDVPIIGPDLIRASEVAIDHVGGGTVTGTEIGDEESYYEIEVTLDDGRQVDVQLDDSFNVVSTEGDGSSED